MSQGRYQLPDRPKATQPTSRFNYRVHLQHSHSASRTQQLEPFVAEQSVFTFDQSTNKSKSKQLPLFEPFEDTNIQTIAKNLIEQNILLKEQLKKHQIIIKELQGELVSSRTQMEQINRTNLIHHVLQDFKKQISTILYKSKMVEEEMNSLRQLLPTINHNLQENKDNLTLQGHKITRWRSNSLDFKRTAKPRGEQQKDSIELGKNDELVSSIKNMHLKMMGFRVQSLKELWRWLKNIGYTYSNFKKWHSKVLSSTQYWRASPETMRSLLEQIISDC